MRLAVERSSTQGQQPVLIRVSDVGWGAFAMAVRSVSLVSAVAVERVVWFSLSVLH